MPDPEISHSSELRAFSANGNAPAGLRIVQGSKEPLQSTLKDRKQRQHLQDRTQATILEMEGKALSPRTIKVIKAGRIN
jgi:hypothetical protein